MKGFDEYYSNSEWHGTYESDLMMKEAFEAGQQSKQAEVDELQKSANEMDEYITTAQRCLSYYLLDQESDENWIGGVQTEIVRLEQENEELRKRIDEAIVCVAGLIEDTYNIDTMYGLENILNILSGEENECL